MVVITRNRLPELRHSLRILVGTPGVREVLVVDNGSEDGTPDAVRREHPDVRVVELGRNIGAAARNIGVAMASSPFVAFADDDSWWCGDALVRAAGLLSRHHEVGLLAGTILLGDDARPDPLNRSLASSPLERRREWPGPEVLGFAACGAVVRRSAFLEAGGFPPRFGVGGEETLVALRLRERGWRSVHAPGLTVAHHPSQMRDHGRRREIAVRNELWTEWSSRPGWAALVRTVRIGVRAALRRHGRAGLAAAMRGAPAIWVDRRSLSAAVNREWMSVTCG